MSDELQDIETFAEENEEMLKRVARLGSTPRTRAMARIMLRKGLDAPDQERVKSEIMEALG
ncbi:hypothetical protein [Halococcus saccharolyticus]|nr:hypothetical protein [Halococcus saccharolyticus]